MYIGMYRQYIQMCVATIYNSNKGNLTETVSDTRTHALSLLSHTTLVWREVGWVVLRNDKSEKYKQNKECKEKYGKNGMSSIKNMYRYLNVRVCVRINMK